MGNVLVVGSGVAGMQASIDLADSGHKVFLIEREEELGGNLRNLSETSPNGQKASNMLSAYLSIIEKSRNITVIKKGELVHFRGSFPKFLVTIRTPKEKKELTVNAVVLATGFQPYNPSTLKQYGYGRLKDVVTTVEVERMLRERRLQKPSNQKKPKSVVFVQCVGSRDCNFNAYCSDFCCNNAVKLARIIKSSHPDVAVSVFYMDMRTPFEGEIEFRNARQLGVLFQRGKPATILEGEDGALTIRVEDTLENDLIFVEADLVVLSVGGVPDPTVKALSQVMKLSLLDSGFFAVDETTVGTNVKGIFVVGGASGPKDIAYSIAQGSCVAVKVDSL